MPQPTDCSALQATLQGLNEFLGQTYIKICKEVAQAEYAVQADFRVLRDLESQLKSSLETHVMQQEEPSSMAAKLCDMHSGVGASSTAVTSELAAADPVVGQHDKLQAVLAQARAIRRQGKSETTNRSHLSSIQPVMPTRPVPRPGTKLNRSSSSHECSAKRHTENINGSDSSNHSHSARPASKSQLPSAQHVQQQLPGKPLPDILSTSQKSTAKTPLAAQPGIGRDASQYPVPLEPPAHFREAFNALRLPGLHHNTQSAASSSRTSASSQAPFINLDDAYNECMASIAETGAAFKRALCPDNQQAGASADVMQSWADPDSENWLRHSALVEAQLRLMQRLSSQLQAHSGRQVCGSNAPDAEEWQEILQLWQEVQQEYHALFETPAGDPDAVLRWRNRAMRFVLSSETHGTCPTQAGSHTPLSSPGNKSDKPAEAWLPSECWAGLEQLPDNGLGHNASAEECHNVLVPPHVRQGGALVNTDPAQLQTICRLQHQLQLYLLQQHIESHLAVSLLPLERIGKSAAGEGSLTSQQALAQIRLAHAFLCKGVEKGLCTIMQEQMQ